MPRTETSEDRWAYHRVGFRWWLDPVRVVIGQKARLFEHRNWIQETVFLLAGSWQEI